MTHHMAQPIPLPTSTARRHAVRARASRIEVRPPELWPSATPAWRAVARWMRALGRRSGEQNAAVAPMRGRLGGARADFVSALADIAGSASTDLQTRVRHARSLRELWHLRPELFSVVARRFSQSEAERRLDVLNAHFPMRAPSSDAA